VGLNYLAKPVTTVRGNGCSSPDTETFPPRQSSVTSSPKNLEPATPSVSARLNTVSPSLRKRHAPQVQQVAGASVISGFGSPQRIRQLNLPVAQGDLLQQARMANKFGVRAIEITTEMERSQLMRAALQRTNDFPNPRHPLNDLDTIARIQSSFESPHSQRGQVLAVQARRSSLEHTMGGNVSRMSQSSSLIPASPAIRQPSLSDFNSLIDPQLFEENQLLQNQAASAQRIGQPSSAHNRSQNVPGFPSNPYFQPLSQLEHSDAGRPFRGISGSIVNTTSQKFAQIAPQQQPAQPRLERSVSNSSAVIHRTQSTGQVVNLHDPVFEQRLCVPLRNSGWDVRTGGLQDIPPDLGNSTGIPDLVVSGHGTTVNFFRAHFKKGLDWAREPSLDVQQHVNSNWEAPSVSGGASDVRHPPAAMLESSNKEGITEAETTSPKETVPATHITTSGGPQKKITDFLKAVRHQAPERAEVETPAPDKHAIAAPSPPPTRLVSIEDDTTMTDSTSQMTVALNTETVKLVSRIHPPQLSPQLLANHLKKSHNRLTKKRSISPHTTLGLPPKRHLTSSQDYQQEVSNLVGTPGQPIPEGHDSAAILNLSSKDGDIGPTLSHRNELPNHPSILGESAQLAKTNPPYPPNTTVYPSFSPMSSGRYSASLYNQQLSQVHQHVKDHPFVASPKTRELIARLPGLPQNSQGQFEDLEWMRSSWNVDDDSCQESLLDLFGREVGEGGRYVRDSEWSDGRADWNQMGGDFQDLLGLTELAKAQNM
jgi:hypothetical protein